MILLFYLNSLKCIYSYFYFQDKKLLHNISAGVITTNQSLVLQRVNRHSAGRYRCVAINREGDTESEIFPLDVKCTSLSNLFK